VKQYHAGDEQQKIELSAHNTPSIRSSAQMAHEIIKTAGIERFSHQQPLTGTSQT